MKPLPQEDSTALSALLRSARESRGWTLAELADRAEQAIHEEAARAVTNGTSNRLLWTHLEVHAYHVQRFEAKPPRPLATPRRRARLLALVLALGLDRAEVNRLAGGI